MAKTLEVKSNKSRLHQIAVAFDQFINAIANGWADETISARAFREAKLGKNNWVLFKRIIDGIFFWQEQHCKRAYKAEQERLQIAPEYRDAEVS